MIYIFAPSPKVAPEALLKGIGFAEKSIYHFKFAPVFVSSFSLLPSTLIPHCSFPNQRIKSPNLIGRVAAPAALATLRVVL